MAVIVNPLTNTIQLLEDFGFFQVVLPMILVFAVFYGVLVKTKIFGDSKEVQYLNAVISFVAAFFVVTSTEVVRAINEFIPRASFLLIILMLFLMSLAFFGLKTEDVFGKPKRWVWIFVLILVVIFLGILDVSLGWEIPVIHGISEGFVGADGGGTGVGGDSTDETISLIIGFAFIVGLPLLIMYVIVQGSSKS